MAEEAKVEEKNVDELIISLLPAKDAKLSENALNVLDSRINAPMKGFPGDQKFADFVENKQWSKFKALHYDWWMFPWSGKSVRGNHGGHHGGKNYQLNRDDFFLLFDYKQELKDNNDNDKEYIFIERFIFGVDALLKAKIEGNVNAVMSGDGVKGDDISKKPKKKKKKKKKNKNMVNANSPLNALFADIKTKKVGIGKVHSKRIRKIMVSLISFRNVALIKQSNEYFNQLNGLYDQMYQIFDLSKLKMQIQADLKVNGILLDDDSINVLTSKLQLKASEQ